MTETSLFNSIASGLISGTILLLARLPAPLRRGVGHGFGWLYAHLATASRKVVIANVEHVREGLLARGVDIGSADNFARRVMQANGVLLVDIALCWRGQPDAWRGLIASVGGPDVEAAQFALRAAASRQVDVNDSPAPIASSSAVNPNNEQPPGVLLLSPHLGNWELINTYLGAEYGVTVMYDPPKISALEPVIRAARQRTASTLLPIGPAGLRGMLQRLRAGGIVGLLPDQVPAVESGVYADFLGKQALTINLVHRLANKHCPRVFLVCAIRNAQGMFDLSFDELTKQIVGCSELSAATSINAAIESRVVQAPEQYQWTYKRFKRPPGGGASIYRT